MKAWVISVLIVGLAALASADILIDFGTTDTWRGYSVDAPDENGNYWNSVDSSAYWVNMVDSENTATTIDMGFIGGFVGGTDSYNGPAGATSVTGPGNASGDYTNAVFNATALGDLGAEQAVFDYYANSGFVLNQLDPTKTYNLTFYGSHKYNTDNVTTYGIYTDSGFSNLVTSVDLTVGVGSAHNQDTTATISNITTTGSLYVYFEGSEGNSGYLNAMSIEVIPEPATLSMIGVVGLGLLFIRRRFLA